MLTVGVLLGNVDGIVERLGLDDGFVVGDPVSDGWRLGCDDMVGRLLKLGTPDTDGCELGLLDGAVEIEGGFDGLVDGTAVKVGASDGTELGPMVGRLLGIKLGAPDIDGWELGLLDGAVEIEGVFDGSVDGAVVKVGASDGTELGPPLSEGRLLGNNECEGLSLGIELGVKLGNVE